MRTSLIYFCCVFLFGACFTGCGKKPAADPAAASKPTAAPAPAKLSAAPALDPKGTIDWAQQNLDAAKAKEQAGATGI